MLLHGRNHWAAVAKQGRRLAADTPGTDLHVVLLFALLHDARRVSDGEDPFHGERGAQLARDLRDEGLLRLSARRMAKLERACAEHTDGLTTRDRTVGVCWDADRLELHRLGVPPDVRFLSTSFGRSRGVESRRGSA